MKNLIEYLSSFVDPITQTFPKIPEALFTFVFGIIFIKIIVTIIGGVMSRPRFKPFKNLFVSISNTVLKGGLVLIILSILGFGKLAAAITGSTAVLMFFLTIGAAPFISDIIAGLSLITDNDFKLGSKIQVGDKKTVGILESTDMRKVRLRDEKGRLHVIPNSVVEKNEWVLMEENKK